MRLNKLSSRPSGWFLLITKIILCGMLLWTPWISAAPFKVYTSDYPPYSFVEDGVQKGMAIDVLKEAFDRMNVELSIEFVPFPRAVNLFKRGDVDGIFPFSKKDERMLYTHFPEEPLVTDVHVMFVRADSSITFTGRLGDLAGYYFGRQRDAFNGQVFAEAVEKGVIRNVHEANDQRQLVLMLAASRFDIAVGPSKVIQYYAKETGKTKNIKELQPSLGSSVPAYLGFSKRSDYVALSKNLDRTLLKMRQDGSYQRLTEPYLK